MVNVPILVELILVTVSVHPEELVKSPPPVFAIETLPPKDPEQVTIESSLPPSKVIVFPLKSHVPD